MKALSKVEHVVKEWEKKYGYFGVTFQERDFFSPLMNRTFTLNVFGNDIPNRTYSKRYRRIYLGRKVFNRLKVGDVLICYRDTKGKYFIEKKK